MKATQKAAFAASALAITLVGAAFVTAPMAFAWSVPIVAQHACATSSPRLTLAGHVDCEIAGSDAGLIAYNRR